MMGSTMKSSPGITLYTRTRAVPRSRAMKAIKRAPWPTHGPEPMTGLIRLGCLIFGCCYGRAPFPRELVEASGWSPGSPEHTVLTRPE